MTDLVGFIQWLSENHTPNSSDLVWDSTAGYVERMVGLHGFPFCLVGLFRLADPVRHGEWSFNTHLEYSQHYTISHSLFLLRGRCLQDSNGIHQSTGYHVT